MYKYQQMFNLILIELQVCKSWWKSIHNVGYYHCTTKYRIKQENKNYSNDNIDWMPLYLSKNSWENGNKLMEKKLIDVSKSFTMVDVGSYEIRTGSTSHRR